MENILQKALKVCQEAEVYEASVEETPVHFEANRLKGLNTRMSSVIALRVIKDGRQGYSISNKLEEPDALVDRAVEISRFGAYAKYTMPSGYTYPQVDVYDSEVAGKIPEEKMVELGQSLIDRVRKHTPELFCGVRVSKSVASIHIFNSKGGEARFNRTAFFIDFEGTLIRGTDMLFVSEMESSCKAISNYGAIADSVIRQLELARVNVPVKSGKLPVVFTPNGVASVFLAPLSVAFNGKMVLQKASRLSDKLGDKVFDGNFFLYDDATIQFHPRSRPCDDEGVPSRATPLVEKGVVKSFLYDLQTAGLAGAKSTGNGSRMTGGLPSPAPSNLVIKPGNSKFDDMVKDIKEGLVVEFVIGAEQGNILSGDFGGNVLLGYKVENGKITGRVKNTMLSGNIYDVLSNITALEDRDKWASGMLRTPSIYCAGLNVASKE